MPDALHSTVLRLTREIDYAMFVVTVEHEGERSGCLVGFATQCSIYPARFLICLSELNHTFRVARDAEVLAVHLVGADRKDVAEIFGGQTGDEVDKLAQVEWTPGPGGAPILAALPNWFAGRVLDRRPVGDHWAFLLEPVAAAAGPEDEPFTFHRAKDIAPGHPPS